MTTIVPTSRLISVFVHLSRAWRVFNYSRDQHRQRNWKNWWRSFQWVCSPTCVLVITGSGIDIRGRPIKKWPGVKHSKSFVSDYAGTKGREFKAASTLHNKVVNSSKFQTREFIARTGNDLADFTTASQIPPKLGAPGGLKCHSHGIWPESWSLLSGWLTNCCSCLAAPTKLVPQSE